MLEFNIGVDAVKSSRFLHGLENLEKLENFFQSGNFEQTGKVREFHPKYWKMRKF